MFKGCTNLTVAPELPATTLTFGCYNIMFEGCTKLSSVTMLASSKEITSKNYCVSMWLNNAGTDPNITRTLKVQDKAAYDALKKDLPTIWEIGSNCKVLDKDGNAITE